jgi:nucleotide-binding universal stress UspA family protein
MDIIDYAQNERLDAIVAGRRGMTTLQEMFMGSVSSSIVQNSGVIPVWLVGGDVEPGKMLVPVDGSEFSLRAIDLMAFIVGPNPEVELTLLHVQPRLSDYCEIDFDLKAIGALASTLSRGDQRCNDNFYAAARQKLADFGIDENRGGIKTVKGLINPGAEIVKEFRSVRYDTIIMGRRGINRNFFTGSVTNYVLNKMPESVIWIVP